MWVVDFGSCLVRFLLEFGWVVVVYGWVIAMVWRLEIVVWMRWREEKEGVCSDASRYYT